MEPTLNDVMTAVTDLRADVDQRLGALADAVDDARLNISAHRRTIEDLLTQFDLAFRAILTALDEKVVEVKTAAATLGTQIDAVGTKADAVNTDVGANDAKIVTLDTKLTDLATTLAAVQSQLTQVQDTVNSL